MDVKLEKVYIAGHNGLLGKSVQKAFSNHAFELVLQTSIELDLRDSESVFDFIYATKPDGIILCAAHVGGIGENYENPLEMHYQNALIQYSVLNAAYKLKIPKLVFVSSAAVFPAAKPLNREDDIWTGVPSKEHLQYATAKISGMEFVKWAREESSLDWISVIPTNIYGENDRWDEKRSHVIAALIIKCVNARVNNSPCVEVWGGGDSRREFLHADDAAEALLLFYSFIEKASFDCFNLGAGTDLSIRELATLIAESCGYFGEVKFNSNKPEGPKERTLDMTRTNQFIDWEPRVHLKDGILRAVSVYQERVGSLG